MHIHRGTETLYMNPAGEHLTGYTLAELQTRGLGDLIHEADRDRLEDWLADFMAGQQDGARQEFRIVRKDRTVRWVSLGATRIQYDGLPAIMVAGYDVTARRLAERDRERLEAAVTHAGEGVVFTDRDGYIRYVNSAFERITGFAREEALGAHNRLLMNAVFDQPVFLERWAALSAGQTWRGRIERRRRDGTLWICQETMSPVRDAAGQVQGYVSIQRDVTTETQAVEQLQQVQRLDAIGRLCSNIAHEFGNATSAITENLELARSRLAQDDTTARHLRNAADASRMATDLTRNLLQFSGKQPVRMAPAPLRRAVAHALSVLQSLLPGSIELRRDFRDVPPVWVTVDRTQMQQLILNLVLNARDAMPAGGRLTLTVDRARAAPHAERAVLRISDSGTGIPKDVSSRLFEPFFTTKADQGGSGLGLSIVHGIVEAHDGTIRVESDPGRGTTFVIELPALSLAKLRARRRSRAKLQERHVLLAVPDRHVRMLLATALEQDGLRVTDVGRAEEVRQLLTAHPGTFAAAVLDLDDSGSELRDAVDALHSAASTPPLVVIQTDGPAHPGGQHVLQRPFAVADLVRTVSKICRKRTTTSSE